MPDYNMQVIESFRANGGRVDGFDHMDLLLLHHVGAKSGEKRVMPLVYLKDAGRYVIFASKAGAPSHPAWYHNLKAHPDVTVELPDGTIDVHADELTGEERDRLFDAQAAAAPQFADYAAKTSRTIPVIALTPRG